MKQLFILFTLTFVLFAGEIRIKGQFEKDSAISIEQIINHETNNKKVLKKIELPNGKLDITLNISETCQLELFGNNGKDAVATSYIYVENGGIYTLELDNSGARKFKLAKEENSKLNTIYKKVEEEYFSLASNFSPDFAKVEYWENKANQVLQTNDVKKESYLGKLITYMYASSELSMPIAFAMRAKENEKAKKLLNNFETKYYSGKKENNGMYYMTLNSLKRLKRKLK